jgi:lysophospholipid acyltransferase (LPLAT)-like uncharacterized protein
MKIRNPRVIKALAWFMTTVIFVWMRTLRYTYIPLGNYRMPDPKRPDDRARGICSFWHEYILLPAYIYSAQGATILISQHSDGEIIAQILKRFGYNVVRGSSTRGGAVALMKLIREGKTHHIGITPDGPRGPRREFQIGAIYLASKTGLEIVVLGTAYRRPWRVKSWDRFAIPRPFSRVCCVSLDSIQVPPDLSSAELETYRLRVQEMIDQATRIAENWADTGHIDPLGYTPASPEETCSSSSIAS